MDDVYAVETAQKLGAPRTIAAVPVSHFGPNGLLVTTVMQ